MRITGSTLLCYDAILAFSYTASLQWIKYWKLYSLLPAELQFFDSIEMYVLLLQAMRKTLSSMHCDGDCDRMLLPASMHFWSLLMCVVCHVDRVMWHHMSTQHMNHRGLFQALTALISHCQWCQMVSRNYVFSHCSWILCSMFDIKRLPFLHFLRRTSLKWPTLCRMGHTQSVDVKSCDVHSVIFAVTHAILLQCSICSETFCFGI